jgi:DNA-directed RNA polymerase specialized sigma24 family protein
MTSANASRTQQTKTNTCDDGLSAFLRIRPRLFGIAYHMLRNAAEAEDVVQDVWLRWQITDRSVVRDAAAFLATTTKRLAINVMQSARSRRETPVESWLPLHPIYGLLAVGTRELGPDGPVHIIEELL